MRDDSPTRSGDASGPSREPPSAAPEGARAKLARWIGRLTVSTKVTLPEERRRARSLTILFLGAITMGLIATLVRTAIDPSYDGVVGIVATFAFYPLLLLSRGPHYRWAAGIASIGVVISSQVVGTVNHEPDLVPAYFGIGMLVASSVLSVRATLLVAGVSVLSMVVAAFVGPPMEPTYLTFVAVLVFVGTSVSVFCAHLQQTYSRELRQRVARLLRSEREMDQLASLDLRDFGKASQAIAASTARVLEAARVTIWTRHGNDVLRLAGASDDTSETEVQAPRYLASLHGQRAVQAPDVLRDPRFAELWPVLEAARTHAVFDYPLREGGKIEAVLRLEYEGAREFTPDEHEAAMSFASYSVHALEVARRLEVEAELRESQRLEAIGVLAGGIAHEFNNLMNVVIGHTELAQKKLPPDAASAPHLERVKHACARFAVLTKQLTALSHPTASLVELADANLLVEDFSKIVAPVIGEDVTLEIRHPEVPAFVRVDRTQLEQVLLNLSVNARQAMPSGGRLTIEVAHERGDAGEADTVCIRVSDTGTGIAPEILPKIFDPFVTSKATGTGLGLSTVKRIVTGLGGTVTVDTTVGRGTTFSVSLAAARDDAARAPVSRAPVDEAALRGSELVLVVEDEPLLQQMMFEGLTGLGYRVLVGSTVDEAVRVCRANKTLGAVVMDVMLPDATGPKAYASMRESNPDLPALFISGYAPEAAGLEPLLRDPAVAFLHKPFTIGTLAQRLRALIEEQGAHRAGAPT